MNHTIVESGHIALDSRGVAWLTETNTKVKEVVLDWIAYGWSPAEIHFQHPHLPMAKIHAAFMYYFDHQAVVDAQIAADTEFADKMAAEAPESPLRRRLREMGRIL